MKTLSFLSSNNNNKNKNFAMILPVLFYEYLAISITRSILPTMIVDGYGLWSYLIVGCMETCKGLLAFIACPLFGKISDRIGRKFCLLATVTGTTMPVCLLAFTSNMWIFAAFVGISGLFSATFPLAFAYISDCVDKRERAPAYGLALATLGLSFCVGPPLGGYIDSSFGEKSVFLTSLILVFVNVIYIIFFLPETVDSVDTDQRPLQKINVALEYLPNTWNFEETFRVFRGDNFMRNIAYIVFLYYTSVWAVVATLMIYCTRYLQFTPITMGWLLSFYGITTVVSEAVLVRLIVPRLGELNSMRLGLLSFSLQTLVLAFSDSPSWVFVSVTFSMLSNLVYPSVSSLVSKIVEESNQGEAQGALNGIKALTEGFGPLVFGGLMSLYERSVLPGAPYLLATMLALRSFLHSYELPENPELYMLQKTVLTSSSPRGAMSPPRFNRQSQQHHQQSPKKANNSEESNEFSSLLNHSDDDSEGVNINI